MTLVLSFLMKLLIYIELKPVLMLPLAPYNHTCYKVLWWYLNRTSRLNQLFAILLIARLRHTSHLPLMTKTD